MQQKNIRNFCIIAHIDHGKSTLADRILEITNAVSKREAKAQLLDNMDIERERGITIKLNTASLKYHYNNEEYLLNLIDTPGHVDFSYEVSRSLAACEGAILVVDAAQGIEAQTLANLYLALESNLTIIPVINKIDLPNADVEKVSKELIDLIGFSKDEIILTSAKTGEGVKKLVDAIVERVPSPEGKSASKLKALIFDSVFDSYKGVIASVRVVDGSLKVGDKIRFMQSGAVYDVTELTINTPKEEKIDELSSGEVGFVVGSIKNIMDVAVGDTITLDENPASEPLPGYKPMKSMVFCGLYPIESTKFEDLRDALNKLKLNDASLVFEPETSTALGFGFRCGFLGLLHLDIIKERITREFNIELITTAPSVVYEVILTNKQTIMVDSPNKLPEIQTISEIKEPYIKTSIFTPSEFIGPIMELCQNKRGNYVSMEYINATRVNIHYELPLSEIVYDFFDKLKSYTKGYASFDYEFIGNRTSNLVKMDILLNGEVIDALSVIVHKDFAYNRGKSVVEQLRKTIPRQMFEIPIQAALGNHIIARATVKALRKDVLAKCYGGDITRKRKLLEKQKEGKKRMKQVGSVELPQEAFMSVLSMDGEE
ncbi:elongation factor 4 [Clostridium sp. CAG:710]|jgi:GTP-binding protein LepA|nr:translation elongation factor 4 [Clostridium sp.]CCZ59349.1 elongation factor 4 [Clostridium sp. CAG:710]